jgi:small subunit ribosomal protein S11
MMGFKGSRKSTPMRRRWPPRRRPQGGRARHAHFEVEVSGPGSGRESALRALQAVGLVVTSIRDVTPIPHNGCRPPKRRRV